MSAEALRAGIGPYAARLDCPGRPRRFDLRYNMPHDNRRDWSLDSASMRTRLVVVLGLILVAGFLAINAAAYYASKQAVRQVLINNELPLTSNNIYSEIQASLLRPIYVSSLMANDTFLKDWMLEGERDVDKVTRYLREIRGKYDVFSTFVVSARTLRYYHYGGVLKTVSPDAAKDAWFFSMKSHPDNYRVDVDSNEAAGFALTIFINHKIFDYDGRFIGVTGLGLNALAVSELIDRYQRTYQRNIYFVSRDGVVTSHRDRSTIGRANIREEPGLAPVASKILEGTAGFLEYQSPDRGNVLLTYRFIPELDWFLLVEQPEREALAQVRQTFFVNTGIGLVITLLVILISGYTVNLFQARLESMAKRDKLTGLYNRQYFDAIFDATTRSRTRGRRPLSLLAFDIDRFKQVNDRYGHLAGDIVCREIASCARRTLRHADVIARWGGDEFMALLDNCDEANAVQVAEKLRREVEDSVRLPGNSDDRVTVSVGVASYRGGDTSDALLMRADSGLYQAKAAGRNCTQVGRFAARIPRATDRTAAQEEHEQASSGA